MAQTTFATTDTLPQARVKLNDNITDLGTQLAAKLTSVSAIAASQIATGTVDTARLGSGTADATTFLRGDNTWQVLAGAGVYSADVDAMLAAANNGAIRTAIGVPATSHVHAGADLTSGTVDTARLGSGTADATTFLRGDNTWQVLAGSGDYSDDVDAMLAAANNGAIRTSLGLPATGTLATLGGVETFTGAKTFSHALFKLGTDGGGDGTHSRLQLPIPAGTTARYEISSGRSTFTDGGGSYTDNIVGLSYNLDGSVAAEPILTFGMESKFRQNGGAPFASEFIFSSSTPDTGGGRTTKRPFQFNQNHTDGTVTHNFAGRVEFFGSDGTQNWILQEGGELQAASAGASITTKNLYAEYLNVAPDAGSGIAAFSAPGEVGAPSLQIAATNPKGIALYLTGTTGVIVFGNSGVAASQLVVETASGVDETLVLKAGKVGVRNNNPQASLDVTGNIAATTTVKTGGYTVAGLSAITSPVAGMGAHVTDATAPTYLGALTGGGAVTCPVFYTGTAWVSH